MDLRFKSLAICQFLNTNVRNILFAFLLFCGFICNAQINTFPYSQTFSNTVPTDFTSTSNSWNFTNSVSSRTGAYSAGLTPAIVNNTKYIYIKIFVQDGYTYSLSFWTKKICGITINVNETPNQTTLLSTFSDPDIKGCNGNGWKESIFIYTSLYTGDMYFQILAPGISEDKIYIDDILITENPPVSLPITLLYLKAENIEYYNRIEWSTASETNNDYFLLEKTKDGLDFSIVCTVPGAGNSSSQRFYTANDVFITDGIVYYKLKQVDYDGKEVSYDMISVDNRLKVAPKLNKITDVLGHEVASTTTGKILFFHYDNGTVIKRYFSEY